MRERLFGKRTKPVKYSSARTRVSSLQGFLGGADFNEVHTRPKLNPGEIPENLEHKFNSGVNRTDNPVQYGPANIPTRRIGKKKFALENDVAAWVRKKGEA